MIVSTTDEILDHHQDMVKKKINKEILTYPHIDDIPEEIAKDLEILITYGNDLTDENITRYPKLKWVQMLSAGLEDLPFTALREKGILVTSAKGIHAIPMSEYVIGGMLHFEKHFDRYLRLQAKQEWERETLVGELYRQSVLVYGTGAIGVRIAEKAEFFGMKVHGVNTSGRPVEPFDDVLTLKEAEERVHEYAYVVIVLPSTKETKGLFSRGYLNRLNEEAVLINVGRGDLIDEEALIDLLSEKRIKGAILDVFQTEPLPKGHPLWTLENVIITPHMSAKSHRYLERCMEIFLANYKAYKTKPAPMEEMVNAVDLSRHY
ncbi:D-2-hydroxyacid dehydrogenase [Salipaludibacillus sp. CUR1]|uniref:D-2-hydroxyacid dehydrogenase n=1 Tax=Salipaludibacillus sp. CUR1 TaxID=2820003 RepID=UPI001E348BA3|nr:D-2-hydroxyacid dehydrogenase [Salipaludibacillus sp. CUR1]MCE7793186.1 D-2-hydroxyacid dehydrogenase [Salipaludibacillus sp. CUR1]